MTTTLPWILKLRISSTDLHMSRKIDSCLLAGFVETVIRLPGKADVVELAGEVNSSSPNYSKTLDGLISLLLTLRNSSSDGSPDVDSTSEPLFHTVPKLGNTLLQEIENLREALGFKRRANDTGYLANTPSYQVSLKPGSVQASFPGAFYKTTADKIQELGIPHFYCNGEYYTTKDYSQSPTAETSSPQS